MSIVIAATSVCGAAQQLSTGDIMVDAGLGAGCITASKTKATFTQRIGVEYIVMDNLEIFGQRFAIGAGFAVTNGYASMGRGEVAGIFDYDYAMTRTGFITDNSGVRQNINETTMVNRSGIGTAVTTFKRDDLTFMPQATLHYTPIDGVDTYLTVGIGVGMLNSYTGGKNGYEGFGTDTYYKNEITSTSNTTTVYAYNDADHADWSFDKATEATFAMAVYAGMRYWFTQNIAANVQVGMISGALKKSWGNSYDLFSIGATYRF